MVRDELPLPHALRKHFRFDRHGLAGDLFRHGGRYISVLRLFLATGILGGYTTFSAFSLETVLLIGRHQYGLASIYVAASVLASVAGLALGAELVRLTA